ncbi:AIPR family protein [Coleofasciculus chthonoplastes]|uniref:AIPR family protein n=1 Tax=Coleofasciculus chthonoplastes TaxID=64178 RepID=UPI003300C5B1
MDKITRTILENFVTENELECLEQSKQFEYFVNYVVISKLHRSSFELDSLDTGDGGDGSIDGLAIIANSRLITDVQELEDIVNDSGYLDCDIAFIQSKISSRFEGSEIGSFIFGVKDFIADEPKLVQNDNLKKLKEIWEAVISKSSYMIHRRPNCKLYYATTGKWVNDQNLLAVSSSGVREIEDSGLFEYVSFEHYGAIELQKLYHETRNKLSSNITFQNRITLPDIDGVKEAFLGILPFNEFLKLIQDSNESMYNIFYDNVRDFQGDNEVNSKIKRTLSERKYDLFCVLNNGVTIVATSLTPAGNRFTLRDYQVVNGCQTSHVLHQSKGMENIDRVNVPVKVIVTEDEDIKNQITLATNSQTEVKPEQLASLTFFQKKLELYYNSIKGEVELYYERRSQQYHATPGVKKTQIISIPIQIKTFAAAFLNAPHLVSGYYGTIAKRFQGKIFESNHKYAPYYASALCYYRLESLFRNNVIDTKYKKIRFHMIMLARMLSMNSIDIPPLNSSKIDKKSEYFISILNNESEYNILFEKTVNIFKVSGLDLSKRQFKAENETDLLITTLRQFLEQN